MDLVSGMTGRHEFPNVDDGNLTCVFFKGSKCSCGDLNENSPHKAHMLEYLVLS